MRLNILLRKNLFKKKKKRTRGHATTEKYNDLAAYSPGQI